MNNLFEPEYHSIDQVVKVLESLRVGLVMEEHNLQQLISESLSRAGLSFTREYKLGPRNRIDFLIAGGIGVEVKKGKPNRQIVINQLMRYTEHQEIRSLILVIERNLDIPREINNKRCYSFGLHRLWGVAL